jgi:hypothetical protein
MKKIFAIALVGLLTVAFSSNAIASPVNDNVEVVYATGDYDAPVFVYSAVNVDCTFTVVPVATDFVNNVADVSVNYTNEGGFSEVSLVLKFSTHGFAIVNETDYLNLPELIPDLTKYVNDYNSTFGSTEHEFYEQIATNVGKLTNWKYIL